MPDQDGYPMDVELDALDAFVGSPREFMDMVDRLWWHDGFQVEDKIIHREPTKTLSISTWGWSGNEEIMDHLQSTWFYMFFWTRHQRGGHYEFEVPDSRWDEALPEPLARRIVEA